MLKQDRIAMGTDNRNKILSRVRSSERCLGRYTYRTIIINKEVPIEIKIIAEGVI